MMRPSKALLMASAVAAAVGAGGPVANPPAPTTPRDPIAFLDGRARQTRRRGLKRGPQSNLPWTTHPEHRLRHILERQCGALSGRQWVRVRRWLTRASRLPVEQRTSGPALIRRRLRPHELLAARGWFVFLVHPKGVVFRAARAGSPWMLLDLRGLISERAA